MLVCSFQIKRLLGLTSPKHSMRLKAPQGDDERRLREQTFEPFENTKTRTESAEPYVTVLIVGERRNWYRSSAKWFM